MAVQNFVLIDETEWCVPWACTSTEIMLLGGLPSTLRFSTFKLLTCQRTSLFQMIHLVISWWIEASRRCHEAMSMLWSMWLLILALPTGDVHSASANVLDLSLLNTKIRKLMDDELGVAYMQVNRKYAKHARVRVCLLPITVIITLATMKLYQNLEHLTPWPRVCHLAQHVAYVHNKEEYF